MSPLTVMQAAVLDAMSAPGVWCTTAGVALVLDVPANRVRRTLCVLHSRGLVTKHDAGWWSKPAPIPKREQWLHEGAAGESVRAGMRQCEAGEVVEYDFSQYASPITAEECAADPGLGRLGG